MLNNLKLEFGDKSLDYIGGSPYRTRVVLTNDDGAYYPVFFEPDKIELDDAKLYQMAMDVVYQKNSNGRAENERFNILGEKIAKYDVLIEKSQKAIEDLEQATREAKQGTVKNEQAVNNAVSELTELVMGVIANFAPVDNVEEVENEEPTE